MHEEFRGVGLGAAGSAALSPRVASRPDHAARSRLGLLSPPAAQDGGGSLDLVELKPALKLLRAAAQNSQGEEERMERSLNWAKRAARKAQLNLAVQFAGIARQIAEAAAESAEQRAATSVGSAHTQRAAQMTSFEA